MATERHSRNSETRRRLDYFNSLLGTDSRESVLKAAQDLWDCPSYEQDVGDGPLRDSYIDALFDVAEVFRNIPPYRVVSPFGYNKAPLPESVISSMSINAWKRAYSMDDGRIRKGRDSAAREAAAHRLGQIYEKAQCLYTAVFWFKRALSHARSVGVAEHVLLNLKGVARNLNTLGHFAEAGPCYEEMLQLIEELPPAEQVASGLAHAAMFQLQHGRQARGEEIMRTLSEEALLPRSRYFGTRRIPHWFVGALHGLGVHYIATGRAQSAETLAADVIAQAARFDKPDLVPPAMYGLAARAALERGDLDAALSELAQVHDVSAREAVIYPAYVDPTTLDLWLDIARIHVARGRFELAFNAYRSLVLSLGGLIADRNYGNTTRLRMYWLQRMVVVIHEMASVWLDIADQNLRAATELDVALTLLQIKVNLFVAVEKSKNVKNPDITDRIFTANRSYAVAARKLTASADEGVLLELEAALLEREQLEKIDLPYAENQLLPPAEIAQLFLGLPQDSSTLSNQFALKAAVIATMVGDIRQLVGPQQIFVDYSLIDYRPPHEGRQGPSQGHRYLATAVTKSDFRVRDLGDATEIDAKCEAFVAACSKAGSLPSMLDQKQPASRHFEADDPDQDVGRGEIDRLSAELYDRIVAPLEPLAPSLTVSPDGLLTAVPFHALVHHDRWLIEDTHITYCHSLHLLENLFTRQYVPERRHLPPARRVALLIGDPDYDGTTFERLPGTAIEIASVKGLLTTARFPDGDGQEGERVFNEVRVHTGADATASRLLAEPIPRMLHIAAHGGVLRKPISSFAERTMRFGEYYRAWDEVGAAPMTELDDGLLRCELRLAQQEGGGDDPARGAALTALELSSLNLLGCHLVVLSACETGAGVPLHGAGALGFQYAVQSTFARAGLVSLWKVLDRETAVFMTDFYQHLLRFEERKMASSYMDTARRYCRRDGQRVHPYYWAAFLFIDGEYDNPMPW
jgi:CHAT domain-containing protein/tetratricopeptide (TPR) repeat protein